MTVLTCKVYGREGHRQRESFNPSYHYDFSEKGKIRAIWVNNSSVTGTNEYTGLVIMRNTKEECLQELEGQLSDGIFENSHVGKVEKQFLDELSDFFS